MESYWSRWSCRPPHAFSFPLPLVILPVTRNAPGTPAVAGTTVQGPPPGGAVAAYQPVSMPSPTLATPALPLSKRTRSTPPAGANERTTGADSLPPKNSTAHFVPLGTRAVNPGSPTQHGTPCKVSMG